MKGQLVKLLAGMATIAIVYGTVGYFLFPAFWLFWLALPVSIGICYGLLPSTLTQIGRLLTAVLISTLVLGVTFFVYLTAAINHFGA